MLPPVGKVKKKSKMYPPYFSKKRRKIPVYVKKKTDVIFGLAKF